MIGFARYARSDFESGTGECAVVVADRFQRVGVATELLSRLGILALGRGITEFTFNAQSHNLPLIRLVRKVVRAPGLRFTGPEVEGRLDIIDLTSYSPLYPSRSLLYAAGTRCGMLGSTTASGADVRRTLPGARKGRAGGRKDDRQ